MSAGSGVACPLGTSFLPHPIVLYFFLWWQRLMHIVSLFLWLSRAEEGQRLEPEASYILGANVFF